MARAKRTNRAEARRRYRAQVAEQANVEPADVPPRAVEPPTRGSRASNEPRPTGMRYAFRAAFRPPNLRDDIAHLPELLRSRAVLLPVLVTIGTAAAIAVTNGADVVSRLLAQYFLVTPPIGSIFIAGFFAPRASYIAGLIVGLVAALALTAVVIATPVAGSTAVPGASPSPSPAASITSSGSPAASTSAAPSGSATASASATAPASPASSGASAVPSPAPSGAGEVVAADPVQVAGSALLYSPVFGIFLASAAAWYRRFLQLANPNRAPARGATRGRPNNRRR